MKFLIVTKSRQALLLEAILQDRNIPFNWPGQITGECRKRFWKDDASNSLNISYLNCV